MLPISSYDPPSSPASSEARTSSSPPSSPIIEPLSQESEIEDEIPPLSRVTDPFAGSYGLRTSNRAKRSAAFTPHATPSKKRRANPYPPVLDDSEDEGRSTTNWSAAQSPVDTDAQLWDRAIEDVFKSGKRTIELTDSNLTRIPPQVISDLDKFFVLPTARGTVDDAGPSFPFARPIAEGTRRAFTRIQTAPASSGLGFGANSSRNKQNALSTSVLFKPSQDVELFLGKNSISTLPVELWYLRDLTILSLRHNQLTHLPPEVAKLQNLVELNVSYNKIKFLPSELRHMKSLRNLVVSSNDFISRPENGGRMLSVSDTRLIGPSVPSLCEMTLRALLRPASNAPDWQPEERHKTVLEDRYMFPLPTGPPYKEMAEPMRRIFSTCVPGSVPTIDPSYASSSAKDPSSAHSDSTIYPITGIGRCPNPRHGMTRSVFVHHVEERYTWVDSLNDIKLGGFVPLRWRGCERGCLRFLDPSDSRRDADEGMEGDVQRVDEDPVIQTVQFQVAELDFDDG